MDAKSSVQNNKVIRIGGVLKWAEKRRPKLGRLFSFRIYHRFEGLDYFNEA
jgi:hypothetical protein